MLVLMLDASPSVSGRTASLLSAIRAGLGTGHAFAHAALRDDADEAVAACARAEAVVIVSPTYRASYTGLLKTFFDSLPRGLYGGEGPTVLAGKAVAIGMCGADWRHSLALADLRNVLAGFFAAVVVPPGVYVPDSGWQDGELAGDLAAFAAHQGSALAELAVAIGQSKWLAQCSPQA